MPSVKSYLFNNYIFLQSPNCSGTVYYPNESILLVECNLLGRDYAIRAC